MVLICGFIALGAAASAIVANVIVYGAALVIAVGAIWLIVELFKDGSVVVVKTKLTIWALLVCTSTGYDYFRHQASIAHSYHILVGGGVKAENIIVMMTTDWIDNKQSNTFPGELFNEPGENAKDVYKGLQVDYTGEDVTYDTILKALSGKDMGEKKKCVPFNDQNRFFQ